jgi:hypothetical protein
MTGSRAEMWKTYMLHGFPVMVVQQWNDPFGTPMVRVIDTSDDERAEGMPEAVFLSQAVPAATAKSE